MMIHLILLVLVTGQEKACVFSSLTTFQERQKRGVLEDGGRLLVTDMCSLTISLRIVARQRRLDGSM